MSGSLVKIKNRESKMVSRWWYSAVIGKGGLQTFVKNISFLLELEIGVSGFFP